MWLGAETKSNRAESSLDGIGTETNRISSEPIPNQIDPRPNRDRTDFGLSSSEAEPILIKKSRTLAGADSSQAGAEQNQNQTEPKTNQT